MRTYSRLCRSFSKLLRPARGFTLIELLVVSLIMVLITSFVLFKQQGFNSSTLLRSLAYSVALSMRQAQVYGVSVRETAIGSNAYASGFGVYFGNTGLTDSSHYFVFADKGNGQLDGNGNPDANSNNICDSSEDCLVQRYTLGNGRGTDYLIKDFCAHNISSGAVECSTSATPITNLTVYFRRPNPDACFATSRNATACAQGTAPIYNYAYVELRASGSKTDGTQDRTIKVTSTGQIEVCTLGADPITC